MKSHNIATKAINNYRKRDIIAYLSLRYYLGTVASKKDIWAREVAVKLSMKKRIPVFLKIKHFKAFNENKIEQRTIYLPGANDIIAESVLINECAKFDDFHSNNSVYSYLLPSEKEGEIYKHYIHGWKNRYLSIKKYCEESSNEEVMYFDIKSFYPSIDLQFVKEVWEDTCLRTKISEKFKKLGLSFLAKYKKIQEDEEKKGLLVGPMFSHLLANLMLKGVDEEMTELTKNRYWRYVDDILVIGNKEELKQYSEKLTQLLKRLNLELHEEKKKFHISTKDWLAYSNQIDNDVSDKWMKFIVLIKQFVVKDSDNITTLMNFFKKEDIRIDIPINFKVKDIYNEDVEFEINGVKKSLSKVKESIDEINLIAIKITFEELRKYYYSLFELKINLEIVNELEAKSHITLLRYLVGRLIYLASEDMLEKIKNKIEHIPELKFQYEIIKAFISLDITYVLKMGTNVAQGAAQVIKLKSKEVTCSNLSPNEYEVQALSIFKFHGINIKFTKNVKLETPLYSFASGIIGSNKKEDNSEFLSEFIALHGNKEVRHKNTLQTFFNENESFSFDAMGENYGYSY